MWLAWPVWWIIKLSGPVVLVVSIGLNRMSSISDISRRNNALHKIADCSCKFDVTAKKLDLGNGIW